MFISGVDPISGIAPVISNTFGWFSTDIFNNSEVAYK